MLRFATFFLLLVFLCSGRIAAHPPYTIVVNSLGQAFYSDLENVWMIDTDGTKRVVLHHVHNHELWLDSGDNLLGEDVQNRGENYRHRIWKLDSNGVITNVVEWTSGHPSDIGGIETIRNPRGESVILQRSLRAIVVGRESDTPRNISLAHIDGYIHELAVDPVGNIYVGVGSSIYRIEDGTTEIERYAHLNIDRTLRFRFVHDRHALMGMYAADSDVYVSVYAGQYVVRIDKNRVVHNEIRSSGSWSPSGVTMDRLGNLWLLEFSSTNKARLSRIDTSGKRTIF